MISMCRLCASLKKTDSLTFIRDSNHDLCHQLSKCCQVTIDVKDILPKGVCTECIRSLNNAFEFYERVHESQQSLQHLFKIGNATATAKTNNMDTNDSMTREHTSLDLMAVAVVTKIENAHDECPLNYESPHNEIDDDEVSLAIEEILGVKDEQPTYLELDSETEDNTQQREQTPEMDTEEGNTINNVHIIPDSLAGIEYIEEDASEIDFDDNNCYEIIEEIEEEATVESLNAADEKDSEEELPSQMPDKDVPTDTWLDFPWKCVNCFKVFRSPTQLIEHNEKVHTVPAPDVQWFCVDCQKTFPRYYTLITHIRQRHRTHLALLCDICNDSCSSFKDLQEHRKSMHSGAANLIMFLCATCGKGFYTSNSLQMHSKCHLPDEQRLKYACPMCDKKFPTTSNLKFHQKMHAGTRDFVCDQCGKNFIQKANLEEHLITHIKVTPYKCALCNKLFKTPERLTRHRQRHTNDKPYSCTECDKTFRTKDAMLTHIRIHTGEMPFKCEFCAKPFRFRSTLTTHHNVHTGIRPYSCEDCDHHFTNWPNYNKHMKRRHGVDVSSRTPRGKKPSKPKLPGSLSISKQDGLAISCLEEEKGEGEDEDGEGEDKVATEYEPENDIAFMKQE